MLQTRLIFLLLPTLMVVSHTNLASEPATRRSDSEVAASYGYYLRATDELRPRLLDLLGDNPIDSAQIKATLVGNRRQVQVDLSVGVKSRAMFDAEGHPVRGFTVIFLPDRPTTTGPVGGGCRRLTGTLKIYVPGKAAAVDFDAELFPADELTDGDPGLLKTGGTIAWKNLRPISYTDDVWPNRPKHH